MELPVDVGDSSQERRDDQACTSQRNRKMICQRKRMTEEATNLHGEQSGNYGQVEPLGFAICCGPAPRTLVRVPKGSGHENTRSQL